MIPKALLRELRRVAGAGHVSVSPVDLEAYSYDASPATGMPGAVVFPADTQQVAGVVRACGAAGIPHLPRGFGTNLSGGSVPPEGGVVICLTRMGRILAVSPERRTAVAQPGVTNLELQDVLAPHGFFYAPDPASQKVATLGGNVGENSGGPHCLKYGVTQNHVLGAELVLPEGGVVRVGGEALDTPGYDLRGLIIGSEGTLAIVTEVTVRIMPSAESVATLLVIYDDVADAAATVSGIIAAGIVPAALEMMDAPVMRAVEESLSCGYPLDAAAVLIIEVDGPQAGLAAQVEQVRDICTAHRCRSVRAADDPVERDLLWTGRRGAFGAISRITPAYSVSDCTVPRTRLPEALAAVAAAADRHGLGHGNVFHAGDGNLHPLLFFDPSDAEQVDRVQQATHEIMDACVALGGTISGEHGVGTEKVGAMDLVFSEDALQLQRALKNAFDPRGLLNPGKAIPETNVAQTLQSADPAAGRTRALGNAGFQPEDENAAADMVRRAFAERTPLLPIGSGSHLDFGNAATGDPVPIRSTGLAGIIDYDPENLVVTVGAGTTLGDVQAALGEHGQWLPLRPPGGRRTIGGVVALGSCGPERLRYGAPRDLLLGLSFVSGEGRVIAAGGSVVKNVAGYDLVRLMAGSAGTLGFITRCTFRVLPRPDVCRAVVLRGTLGQCAGASAELLGARLEPTFVSAAPDASGWRMTVGFEGFADVVGSQAQRCADLALAHELTHDGARDFDLERGAQPEPQASPFAIRAGLPLDRVEEFAGDVTPALVDFGCGRVLIGADDLTDDVWTSLCARAAELGGHVIVERAPDDFKQRHDVFGPARPEWALMHRVKDALDPRGIFAPGRLPGAGQEIG